MNSHNDNAFETFWKLVRAGILWGGIVRGTRFTAHTILSALPIPLTHHHATLIAQTLNDLPEDCKTSELTIKTFLKHQPQLLQCLQDVPCQKHL